MEAYGFLKIYICANHVINAISLIKGAQKKELFTVRKELLGVVGGAFYFNFFLFKKRIIMAIIDGGWVVNLFFYYRNTKVSVQNKTKNTDFLAKGLVVT